LLAELNERQCDVRELLGEIRETPDKAFADGLAGNLGHPDPVIVAVVLARLEMDHAHPDREPTKMDLIWAGELLDHLDTQGFQFCRRLE
jgi:hypothetical protein